MIYGVKPKGGAYVAFALYNGEFHKKFYCSSRKEAEEKIKEWKQPNW